MYTTYHLDSAQDINEDIFELTEEMKKILDERLKEDGSDYISSEESIAQLKSKYGL